MPDADRLFEALVRDHARTLAVYLRSCVQDPVAIDDLFQETLVSAWRAIDRYDPERSFGSWIRGIARNLIRERIARGVRMRVVPLDDAALERVDGYCEAMHRGAGSEREAQLDALRDCLEALPDHYCEAVRARYEEGLRGPDLAERLRVSWECTKKRLQRGRKLLLQCMERSWSASGGVA